MAASKEERLQALRDKASQRGGILLSTEYVRSHSKYLWRCQKGHEWQAAGSSIVSAGSWCPLCSRLQRSQSRRLSDGLLRLQAAALKRDGECLSTEYINRHSKYLWKCSQGHSWQATAGNVLLGKWCKKCSDAAKGLLCRYPRGFERLRALARAHGGLLLSTEYTNTGTNYLWRCQKGHEWQATARNALSHDSWCPQCSNCGPSRGQLEVEDLVRSLLPCQEVLRCDRKVIGPLELDIWIPGLRKAIEYDGEYWHQTPEAQERDSRKTRACCQAGIGLLRISDKHWTLNSEAVIVALKFFLEA